MIYEDFNWKCITRVVLVVPALWIVECSSSFFWGFSSTCTFHAIFFVYRFLNSSTKCWQVERSKELFLQFSVLHAMRCLELKNVYFLSREISLLTQLQRFVAFQDSSKTVLRFQSFYNFKSLIAQEWKMLFCCKEIWWCFFASGCIFRIFLSF